MSFAFRNLCVLAYANGFTLWHYKAGPDPLEDVAGQGFFADASDMLSQGDMIMISARNGGRIAGVETRQGQPALTDLQL
ncbi:hypothetical protein ACELLULO517_04075 [Acidisoma cellulosilytica]|uniref:Uncharacterized protein n=1 Tax=Acidisoma cellulosilyticum TaxID=2802395 RepID=A0A963Z047_9PROT|nr:hypothetical protein [Acidisoma cellulosilyticum]MCB8879398.1 hypothetical protein [Acidisoma cellulosilyticum]